MNVIAKLLALLTKALNAASYGLNGRRATTFGVVCALVEDLPDEPSHVVCNGPDGLVEPESGQETSKGGLKPLLVFTAAFAQWQRILRRNRFPLDALAAIARNAG